MRLLVVDDETSLLNLLGQYLTRHGHTVQTASSASGACERIGVSAEGGFDVAIVDIGLPDVSGIELARQLLERYPRLRVVLASGYSVDLDVFPIALRSRVRMVQKPFLPKTLLELLDEWVDTAPSTRSFGHNGG